MTDLARDHEACAALLQRSRSNFAVPIRLLPREKRRGTTALYAFCRRADDLVDDEPNTAAARRAVEQFSAHLDEALGGSGSPDPILRALADTVRRFAIPPEYLHDILDGVRMDLDRQTYETFDELRDYCRRVASAVGLAAIHVWGFRSSAAIPVAEACGLAFQLTNILRDIPEDRGRGRLYLPAADLAAHGCRMSDLEAGRIGPEFAQLAAMQVRRAEAFYDEARRLDPLLTTDGRAVYRAMFGVYRGLLDGVRHAGAAIFTEKVRPRMSLVLAKGLATVAFGTAKWRWLS